MQSKVSKEQSLVKNKSRNAQDDRDYPFLVKLAQDKNCIFDLGANHGITALIMASVMPNSGQLYAFEASEGSVYTPKK